MFSFAKKTQISECHRACEYYRIDEVRREDGWIDDRVVVIDLRALMLREEERFNSELPCLSDSNAKHEALTPYFVRR